MAVLKYLLMLLTYNLLYDLVGKLYCHVKPSYYITVTVIALRSTVFPSRFHTNGGLFSLESSGLILPEGWTHDC